MKVLSKSLRSASSALAKRKVVQDYNGIRLYGCSCACICQGGYDANADGGDHSQTSQSSSGG